MSESVVELSDGLQNVAANLGTARDKAAHTTYTANLMSSQELYNFYNGSWLAAAIVDYPAEDATRKWRHWRADKDQIEKIEAVEKELDIKERVHEALVAARLYGGSAIYANTKDRRQDKPLRVGSEIISLVVLTSNTLKRGEIVKDINSKYFGKAEFYTITGNDGSQQKIHASRLAVFYGARMPADSQQFDVLGQWGRSVLSSTLDAINNTNSTMANVASLVFEAKVDVLKFKGFANLLAQGGDQKVFSRLHSQAAIKGINGAVVLDSEDEYDQKNASFASLPDIMREFKDDVSGAARIPSTRLFGRTSASLANTGDGDERLYYDRIEHEQTTEVGPALSLFDECLIIQALGSRPPEIFYEWAPLRQISGKERADIFKTTADAARSIAGATAGPLVPLDALSDALANELSEQGVLPGLDQAIVEYGTLAEQGLPPEDDDLASTAESKVSDALPMPLYVSRKVLNAKEILRHYKNQGLEDLIDPSDMHVTITYSRNPVDWMKMGESWDGDLKINAGGARLTEAFGETGNALVLSFVSSNLSWRHESMVHAGASWDWPEYQPHITVSYSFSGNASDIKPWTGEIELGPEIFEAIKNGSQTSGDE